MRYALGFGLLALGGILLASVVPACSDEGEGQPCYIASGVTECQNGYACIKAPNGAVALNGNVNGVCCPGDLALATQLICQQPSLPLPVDGGTIDSATGDALAAPDGVDGSRPDGGVPEGSVPDGAQDGPSEGAADAPADGG